MTTSKPAPQKIANPFRIFVGDQLHPGSQPAATTINGVAPSRIGLNMIAIDEGTPVIVQTEVTPLGDAVRITATVDTTLHGQCSRCLEEFDLPYTFDLEEIATADAVAITGDEADDDEDDILMVDEQEMVDLTQSVIDYVGLDLPFDPCCEDAELTCDPEVIARLEQTETLPDELPAGVDKRWAGLQGILGQED